MNRDHRDERRARPFARGAEVLAALGMAVGFPMLAAAAVSGMLVLLGPANSWARTIAASPESSLARAFAALAPGDTLELRRGVYFEDKLVLAAKGTAGAPITIRSAKGGRAWIGRGAVIEPSGGAAAPNATEPAGPWIEVDAHRGIWRLENPAPAGAHGGFLLDAGVQLLPYSDREAFTSPTPGVDGYVGPGIFFAGDSVLVRLQLASGDLLDAEGHPALEGPFVSDPNRQRILIASGDAPTLTVRGASHVTLLDLDFAPGGRRTIALSEGAHHVTLENCDVLSRTIGVAVDESVSDLAILRCSFTMDFPPWIYWSDVKGASKGSDFAPAADAGWNGFAVTGVLRKAVITDSRFDRIFDGIFLQAGSSQVLVAGNTFARGRDDAIDLSPYVGEIEIAHNVIWRCFEGVSLVGGTGGTSERRPGASGPASRVGDVFLHHNVIDVSAKQRAEREGDFAVFHATWSAGIPFGRHDCGGECDRARWRLYRNTILGRDSRNLLPPGLPEAVLARNVFFDFGDALLRSDALFIDNVFWVGQGESKGDEDPLDALGLGAVAADPKFDAAAIARPDLPASIEELRARYRPGTPLGVEVTQLLPPDWPSVGKDEVAGALP